MSAATATIEQTANCIEAAAESRREIERLCLELTRESSKLRTLAEYVSLAGDKVLIDDACVKTINGTMGELVDLMGELR